MNIKVKINEELDIKRNKSYNDLIYFYQKKEEDIYRVISGVYHNGVMSGMDWNIPQMDEFEKKQHEFTKKITELEYKKYNKIFNKLLEIHRENLILKKALKDNNIEIYID